MTHHQVPASHTVMPGCSPSVGLQRIEPQAEAVEIVVADGARGAPGREFAERPQLRDTRRDAAGRRRSSARRSLPTVKPLQRVLAQGEGEPSLAAALQRHHRLADGHDLARLGDQDADVPSTGATSLVLSSFACRSATVASASATLASASARSSAVGPALRGRELGALEVEVGLRLGERGGALVELLAAGEVPRRQRDGARILLLGQQQVGLGRLARFARAIATSSARTPE